MSFVSKVTSGTGVASLSINQSNVLDVSIRSNREEYVKALEGVSMAVWKGEKSEKTVWSCLIIRLLITMYG